MLSLTDAARVSCHLHEGKPTALYLIQGYKLIHYVEGIFSRDTTLRITRRTPSSHRRAVCPLLPAKHQLLV